MASSSCFWVTVIVPFNKTTVAQQEENFNYFPSKPFLDKSEIKSIFADCDMPSDCFDRKRFYSPNPKGFWRVDKDKDPELRRTVLTLVAFHDLEEKIRECGGDRVSKSSLNGTVRG